MKECIFCNIANNKKEEFVVERAEFVVFNDINPATPIHMLFVPKEHISSIKDLQDRHKGLIADMIFTAKDIAKQEKLEGYQLLFNVGRRGGQVVFHLHMHLMGRPRSKAMAEGPSKEK